MSIWESVTVALEAIFSNKMRSLLTMLGIIIGISSVITIVALGDGTQSLIQKEFESFGVQRAYLSINRNESFSEKDYITTADMEAILAAFPNEIKGISPYAGDMAKMQKNNKTITLQLNGVNGQYDQIENIDMAYGRFIMDEDIKNVRQVAVIDSDLALQLFGRLNVIGETISTTVRDQSVSLSIIGVFEKKKSTFAQFGMDDNSSVYTPIPVITNLQAKNGDSFSGVDINFQQDVAANATLQKIITLMERRHNNAGENLYRSYTAESEMAMVDQIMGILTLVIGAIAAISLLVGGIGVMNIMLVSVTERTKEIGIRKAIGAKYKDIMSQFLIESMIISAMGGIIGIVFGLTTSTIIALIVGFPPSISIGAVIIATIFSSAVGIFFGYYPAKKAAKLDPIDALRYE